VVKHSHTSLHLLCYLFFLGQLSMTTEPTLHNRVALVTGAGRRLGRAIALRLASEGSDVAVHYGKSQQEALEVVREIEKLGRRSIAIQADLTCVEQIHELIARVASEFQRLEILINSAANFLETKFGQTSEATWDASLDTNLKAPFFCCQSAAPYLTQSGNGIIINFADIGGLMGWREFLPHSISKAGVILLTRILAKELAPKVRVNAIAPGTITMPGDPPAWQSDFTKRAPLGRTGRPQDVTDAVMFLIRAEFMTGHTLVLDGGRTL
jgi:pteridine reductase